MEQNEEIAARKAQLLEGQYRVGEHADTSCAFFETFSFFFSEQNRSVGTKGGVGESAESSAEREGNSREGKRFGCVDIIREKVW